MFLHTFLFPGCPREAPETLPGRFREAPRSTREAPGKHREASGTLSWPTCTSEPINFKKYKKTNNVFAYFFVPGKPPGSTRDASERFPGRPREALGRHPVSLVPCLLSLSLYLVSRSCCLLFCMASACDKCFPVPSRRQVSFARQYAA